MMQGCKVEGDLVGASTVIFKPGEAQVNAEEILADCKSPGAVGLIL